MTELNRADAQVYSRSARVGIGRTYAFEAERYGVTRAGMAYSRRFGTVDWPRGSLVIDYAPSVVYTPRVTNGAVRYRPSYTYTGSKHLPGYTIYEPEYDVTTAPGWWTPARTYRPVARSSRVLVSVDPSGQLGVVSRSRDALFHRPYYTFVAPVRTKSTLDVCPSYMIPYAITRVHHAGP